MVWDSVEHRGEALKLKIECIARLENRLKPMSPYDEGIRIGLDKVHEIRNRFVGQLLENAMDDIAINHESYKTVEVHIDEALVVLCDAIRQLDGEPLVFLLNSEAADVLAYKKENGLD